MFAVRLSQKMSLLKGNPYALASAGYFLQVKLPGDVQYTETQDVVVLTFNFLSAIL